MDVKPYTFAYSELKSATQDFNPSNKLGEGGFGSVYKVIPELSSTRTGNGIAKTYRNEYVRHRYSNIYICIFSKTLGIMI